MKHIAVITGGDSSEREVSLRSGKAVYDALIQLWCKTSLYDFPSQRDEFLSHYHDIDWVFIMIHGKGGEDGQIASFLNTLWIPYHCTSPDILALTINKRLTKQVRRYYDIPVAQDRLVDLTLSIPDYKWPCVVKALDQWSSVGVVICHSQEEFSAAVIQLKHYWLVLIEEYLIWREITISLIDDPNGGVIVLPTIEIVPQDGVRFDYDNKYNWATKEIFLTGIDVWLQDRIDDIAVRAYTSLKMTRYGRIDMILTDRGPLCLEINTIPGFTDQSLFPKAAEKYWWNFLQLVNTLLSSMLYS